jgi:hypothetical protein
VTQYSVKEYKLKVLDKEMDNLVLLQMDVKKTMDLVGVMDVLVFTGKKSGRPKKGIVSDGLVQLRIQNFEESFREQ